MGRLGLAADGDRPFFIEHAAGGRRRPGAAARIDERDLDEPNLNQRWEVAEAGTGGPRLST